MERMKSLPRKKPQESNWGERREKTGTIKRNKHMSYALCVSENKNTNSASFRLKEPHMKTHKYTAETQRSRLRSCED